MFHSLSNSESVSVGERRNVWAIVDLLVFGLFFVIAFIALAFSLSGLSPIVVILGQGLFNCVLLAFIALWVRGVKHDSLVNYLHFFRSPAFSTRALIVLGSLSAVIVSTISIFVPKAETPLEKFLSSGNAVVLFAIFAVSVAPLTEELIVRGFLFRVLNEIGGPKLAIAGTSIIFAVPHFLQLGGTWILGALIFVVGCLLSVVRYRSNSVISSIIVHTAYNASLILVGPLISVLQKALLKQG